MRLNLNDVAQQAMGFLVEQTSAIEAEVYRTAYPDIQYPSLVPVDTSAPEWAKSVTFYGMDRTGEAAWFNHMATDMRLADVSRSKYEQGIEMAGIGYRYTLEEIGQALMLGIGLPAERADAARRAYEEFVDSVAWLGDTSKDWTGIANNADVTRVDAANDGTGSTRTWTTKTNDQIIRDINDALVGVYTASLTVEVADTVLLPIAAAGLLASRRLENSGESLLSYVMRNNAYTLLTGTPIVIRGILGLETAGNSGVGRMVVYRRDPRVVKMHIPMPFRFLSVWQTGPMTYDVPGIFRVGGVEVRRPGAMRYVDGITAAP